jgi:hypothetical protein
MKFELDVPTNLNEITLGQYQKFLVTKDGSNDEEFIAQKMVEIFCGIELKEIAKMKFTDLNDLILHFTKIFEVKPKFQPTFKIGTQEFGFITSLEDISFGEYVDLENNLLKWETYHKAMAVMYRPITLKFKNQYKIADYEPNKDMQDLMKFAPVDIAISSSVFFWNLGTDLLASSLSYLENQVQKDPKMAENLTKQLNLASTGVGINPFTHLHKETLQDLKQLPNINLLNVLPILRSKSRSRKSNKEN